VNPRIPLAEYPAASQFLRAYVGDYRRTAPWFHYSPFDSDSFERRIAELESRPAIDRRGLAQAVAAQQLRWGAGPKALAAAEALGEPGVYTVVCGQQAGLFGGPLYTQHKAVSAIKLARELSARFPGKHFIPLFWMGTSDSDYEEIRRAWVLGRDGAPLELALPPAPPEDEGVIVAARGLRIELDALLAGLDELLPGGEHREAVLAALREDYREHPGDGPAGIANGFARFMARLFQNTELVLLDPQDAALMPAASGLIERELSEGGVVERELARRNAEIAAAGFHQQVENLPGDTNIFLLDSRGRRLKIARDGAGFVLRQTGERFSAEALLELARKSPERFVAGVMLRPVYQDLLFPPAAFIGGGAELAYRAQGTVVFERHGQRLAPSFHRASATLLPAKSAAALDESGLRLADLYALPQDLAARAVAQDRPEALDAALERFRILLMGADREIEEQAVAIDPTLGETFTTLRGNLERHIEKLEKKILSSVKQKNETQLKRIGLVQQQAYPRQAPQERVLSLINFLPRYGFSLVETLLAELDSTGFSHQTIILE
jgi:bacillithiol synthase